MIKTTLAIVGILALGAILGSDFCLAVLQGMDRLVSTAGSALSSVLDFFCSLF